MKYTEKQQEAITTINQNLQIIACAGSGKTQVISARIIEILKQDKDVQPKNIVAFTFTDKAAGELKDRIYSLANKELGSTQGFAEMFVGTIHGYCLNLLQSPPVYKYLKYGILDEIQQRLLIDRYSNKSGLTETPLIKDGFLKKYIDSKLYQQLLDILAGGGVDLKKVNPSVINATQKYQKLIDEKRYLDFVTIISDAVRIIKENQEVRDKIGSEVKFLVVDEYQDVNPLEEDLIVEFEKLGANVCVVGDDDQTIYQWRGSDVSNIMTFSKRYQSVKETPLVDNFRSSVGVVAAAQKVIENNNPNRLLKKMISADSQQFERGDILALQFATAKDEARSITAQILKLLGSVYKDKADAAERGLTYSDFSILLRSVKKDAPIIIQELEAANIPYIVVGMNGLFDTVEVQALMHVFYYLAGFVDPDFGVTTRELLKKVIDDAQLGVSEENLLAGLDYLDLQKSKMAPRLIGDLDLQKVYLDFLEKIEIREEKVSQRRKRESGEIVFYNLGKFSQVISDYSLIHYSTPANELYINFAKFLYHQAADYYPEGWQDAAYTKPDAVQIQTVHQAKGMQWPVVFVPCLRKNRFPSRRPGGRSVWNIIPEVSVKNADRYKGTVEDERRLFYVALTRAEKYLFCSFSPDGDKKQYQKLSDFFREFTSSEYVLTKELEREYRRSDNIHPRKVEINVALTFSELKYYFDCPYLFKLRFMYGFNPPIVQALGYGKSLHDMLAEIHSESIRGKVPFITDVPRLVEAHLHLPFAMTPVVENLRNSAVKSITRYLQEHQSNLDKLEHVEKIIELKLDDGIVVNGRIDLIRRTDTGETIIVDFKSDERAQAEDITMKQLHVYAFGYQQLTGTQADLIEIHNLDKGGAKREVVDDAVVTNTINNIVDAGKKLRENILPRLPVWENKCATCDVAGICRSKPIQ